MNRREWIKSALLAVGNFCLSPWDLDSEGSSFAMGKRPSPAHEARFYETLKDGSIRCAVCFRNCVVRDGERGFCRNKENRVGRYSTLVHSLPCAIHVDPVEKEPAFHLLPGSDIYCLAAAGCNSRCRFCQNWQISQMSVEETFNEHLPPEAAVASAASRKIPTISFTYSDPIAFYEYMYDIARLAKSAGLKILIHSNGTFNPRPLEELLRYATAVTIDLKGFNERFYREVTTLSLKATLESLKLIRSSGVWLEIVNLTIPTLNDDPDDVKKMCAWIGENLGTEVPLHFTRFFPAYRLTNLPPTPVSTLERNLEIARRTGLKFVYIGNVPGHERNSTFCPACGKKIVRRVHFGVVFNEVKNGTCGFCGHPIPGVWA